MRLLVLNWTIGGDALWLQTGQLALGGTSSAEAAARAGGSVARRELARSALGPEGPALPRLELLVAAAPSDDAEMMVGRVEPQ